MDQRTASTSFDQRMALEELIRYLVGSIDAGRAEPAPFYHLELAQIFPADVYTQMLEALPNRSDYRPMSGRSKGLDLDDGTHTRVKLDLFPEYIRHLPLAKRKVWNLVGGALRSTEVRDAFVSKLAPALERRFGPKFKSVGMFPIPILTRDIPGYLITPHTDTQWKGITVQLYLPSDARTPNIGTIFHDILPDGSMPKRKQMQFVPNSGYAFAVGDDTWHSADPVTADVTTRDSILLTYFVDAGALRFLRNRGKRLGNFLLNEYRNLRARGGH